MKTIQCLAAIASVISMFAVSAHADGWYAVGSVGQAKVKDVGQSANDQFLIDNGATGLVSTVDEKNNMAYKLQLGYRVSPYVAVEGGYVDLGKATYQATFVGGNAYEESRASGLTLALLGSIPFGEQLSVYGKLGVINAKVTQKFTISGAGTATADSTDMKANFGIGARYDFSKSFGVRMEWERFNKLGNSNITFDGYPTIKSNVDLMTIGLIDNF
jgi:OOP family OmpA-OmpF porin